MSVDIHSGNKIEDETIFRFTRIQLELLEESFIECFYVGYQDRNLEEFDNTHYMRVNEIQTINELFYLIGYRFASSEIALSEMAQKNLPGLEGFRVTILNYLDRFNIRLFYERNN